MMHSALEEKTHSKSMLEKAISVGRRVRSFQTEILASVVAALGLFIGFFYRLSWRFEESFLYFGIISSLFLLLLIASVFVCLRYDHVRQKEKEQIDHHEDSLRSEWVFGVMAVVLLMDFYIFSDWLAPVPWTILAILVLGGGCTVGLKKSWDSAWRFLGLVGALYFTTIVVVEPINIEKADMLPLVRMGIESFLDGATPYAQRSESIGTFILEFHYLPGLWLSYLPTVALDLDMRLYNLLALGGLVGLLFLGFHRTYDHRVLGLTLLPVIFSPVVVPLVAHGHIWPFWLATAAFGVVFLKGRLIGAAILLGLLLATRQMALFIAAPVAVYLLLRIKFSESLRFGTIAVVIFLGIIGPFWAFSPDFLTETYLGFESKGLAHIKEMGNPLNQISFAGLLYHLGLYEISRPIQIMILLAFFGFIIRDRSMDTGRFLRLCGVVYLLLIGFNPFVYPYHYVSGLLLLAIGFADPKPLVKAQGFSV
ncbi:hypothetical protein [Candidatus Nitronereus thalassa]|uniref:DUF2029 domain-containing protein n=1 Tax=Candidatus Nitronereus thalassa TaxID=3020898 RepID=A0ABU3K6D3_9BACT|nr:hypothetical protein [Candidatus Nitronereus thalassa]MDT7041967.1 hypothetical protein [Candidatus Nitronereus thalassa]